MRYVILILILIPVVAAGVWAAYALATHRQSKGSIAGSGREDADEPTELTGEEQHKRRRLL